MTHLQAGVVVVEVAILVGLKVLAMILGRS